MVGLRYLVESQAGGGSIAGYAVGICMVDGSWLATAKIANVYLAGLLRRWVEPMFMKGKFWVHASTHAFCYVLLDVAVCDVQVHSLPPRSSALVAGDLFVSDCVLRERASSIIMATFVPM